MLQRAGVLDSRCGAEKLPTRTGGRLSNGTKLVVVWHQVSAALTAR
jgi:hypothetical protein